MDKLKFDRKGLLTILKENREKHRQEYDEAMVGFGQETIKYFHEVSKKYAKAAKEIEAGKDVKEVLNATGILNGLPQPKNHLKDYDRVAKMLELTTDDEVELNHQEVAQYIQDDWDWKEQFTTSTSRYK